MARLREDTDVVMGEDGAIVGHISEDWRHSFGILGGYVAAIALRGGALAHGRGDALRPASISAHYLAPAVPGPVEGTCAVLRNGRTAAYVRVELTQGARERPLLTSTLVFHRTSDGPAYEERACDPRGPAAAMAAPPSSVPFPDTSHPLFQLAVALRTPREDLEPCEEPSTLRTWMRFRGGGWGDDGSVAAAGLCALADLSMLPAARRSFRERWVVPSLDLYVQFHHPPAPSEDAPWLLARSRSPYAAGGVIGGQTEVWSRDGRLLATAAQQLTALRPPSG